MSRVALGLTLAILAGGCASYPGASERADQRAAEAYEREARNCESVMIIRKRSTRLRRPYGRDELLTARCGQ